MELTNAVNDAIEFIESFNGSDAVSDQAQALAARLREVHGNLVWEVIENVQESYTLAMRGAGIGGRERQEVTGTVTDAVVNHYGVE